MYVCLRDCGCGFCRCILVPAPGTKREAFAFRARPLLGLKESVPPASSFIGMGLEYNTDPDF